MSDGVELMLTVIIFTRDRPDEVIRLLQSLESSPWKVRIYDNGRVPIGTRLPNNERVVYVHTPGHWGLNMALSARDLDTDYAVIVDDDGLLLRPGVEAAIRMLDEDPTLVAAEGAIADFAVHGDEARVHAAQRSCLELAREPSRVGRVVNLYQSFSYAPFYAVIRADAYRASMIPTSTIERLASSGNVGCPVFVGLLAIQGRIGHLETAVSLREIRLDSNDADAMGLWAGDWLDGPKYSAEVTECRAVFASALVDCGAAPPHEVDGCLESFERFARIMKRPGKPPTRLRRAITRLMRRAGHIHLRASRATATAPEPLSSTPYHTDPRLGPEVASILIDVLGVSRVLEVSRPRDLTVGRPS